MRPFVWLQAVAGAARAGFSPCWLQPACQRLPHASKLKSQTDISAAHRRTGVFGLLERSLPSNLGGFFGWVNCGIQVESVTPSLPAPKTGTGVLHYREIQTVRVEVSWLNGRIIHEEKYSPDRTARQDP